MFHFGRFVFFGKYREDGNLMIEEFRRAEEEDFRRS